MQAPLLTHLMDIMNPSLTRCSGFLEAMLTVDPTLAVSINFIYFILI